MKKFLNFFLIGLASLISASAQSAYHQIYIGKIPKSSAEQPTFYAIYCNGSLKSEENGLSFFTNESSVFMLEGSEDEVLKPYSGDVVFRREGNRWISNGKEELTPIEQEYAAGMYALLISSINFATREDQTDFVGKYYSKRGVSVMGMSGPSINLIFTSDDGSVWFSTPSDDGKYMVSTRIYGSIEMKNIQKIYQTVRAARYGEMGKEQIIGLAETFDDFIDNEQIEIAAWEMDD